MRLPEEADLTPEVKDISSQVHVLHSTALRESALQISLSLRCYLICKHLADNCRQQQLADNINLLTTTTCDNKNLPTTFGAIEEHIKRVRWFVMLL